MLQSVCLPRCAINHDLIFGKVFTRHCQTPRSVDARSAKRALNRANLSLGSPLREGEQQPTVSLPDFAASFPNGVVSVIQLRLISARRAADVTVVQQDARPVMCGHSMGISLLQGEGGKVWNRRNLVARAGPDEGPESTPSGPESAEGARPSVSGANLMLAPSPHCPPGCRRC
jgi:hypothetical protein